MSVSLSHRGHPHGVIVIVLRYGIRLGADVRENRAQARADAYHLRVFLSVLFQLFYFLIAYEHWQWVGI